MAGRRVARCAVMLGLLGVVATSASSAQPLDREIDRLLSNDCEQLGVMGGNDSFPGSLGPNLDAICEASLPGNAIGNAGGGGAAPSPGSGSALARQRADERLEQERQDAGADAGGLVDFARRFRIDGLGVWVSGDIEDRNRDVTQFEDGYDSSVGSLGAGVDYRFTESLFAGLAIQYQQVDGDFDAGGDFETETLGGTFYGSLAPIPGAFLDVVVGYASKDYAVDRAVSFEELVDNQIDGRLLIDYAVSGISSGDTDGEELQASGQLGYDHAWGALGLGPRVGLDFVRNEIDGYRESGGTGLELVYDDRTRQSLRSSVGLNASLTASAGFGVIVPQLDFAWVHEFQDDQRTTQVRFAEDLRAQPLVFRFQNEKPDRDFFELRGGLSMVLPYGLQGFVQVRTLLGHDQYQGYGASVGLRVALGEGGASPAPGP